ncbi:hypothetical protein BDV38DRAFT_248851 [Aspergillus pseudotamarii]|uniref:Uncharacterized protein n=1 Tax=Aspergillus pseudotamarii TaxID=132259 RepID=A0A5N6ST37_ASPPS|nr:uncharacterized protein BDV38DRAFT_248851 [Aspergillus pseudotamarii]KAE8136951.1 hypothetical protein BDV38DRAFT_248851 [Aspergillus pseudotamarii]
MSPIELPSPCKGTRQSHDYPNTTNGNPDKPLSGTQLYHHCFHHGRRRIQTGYREGIGQSAAIELLLWRRVSAMPDRYEGQDVRGLSPKAIASLEERRISR